MLNTLEQEFEKLGKWEGLYQMRCVLSVGVSSMYPSEHLPKFICEDFMQLCSHKLL